MHKYVAVDVELYISNAYSVIQYLLKPNIYWYSVSFEIKHLTTSNAWSTSSLAFKSCLYIITFTFNWCVCKVKEF